MEYSKEHLWKPVWLLAGQLLALLLLVSWLYPATHQLWQQLDTWFFWKMNGSMIGQPGWQYVVALANYRLADLLPAFLVVVLYLHFCLKSVDSAQFNQRITSGVTIFVLLLVTIVIFKFGIFEFLLHYLGLTDLLPRRSATYVFENALRLDELYPSINTKVDSKDSFPGDHASVLLFFAVFIRFYAGRIYGSLALLIALIFIMPRLIGGAHWLSDVLVGGGYIALASTSLYLATPIHQFISDKLAKHVAAALSWLTGLKNKLVR